MSKFVSIMTNTYSSEITYDEWLKRIINFFFHDKRIVQLLKQNGMTKWTIYKTEDVEPLKVIAICEYKNDESFQKCQKVFFKIFTKNTRPYHKNQFRQSTCCRGCNLRT